MDPEAKGLRHTSPGNALGKKMIGRLQAEGLLDTGRIPFGRMMGQPFRLHSLSRPKPRAATANAALPWASMDEAVGLGKKTGGHGRRSQVKSPIDD